MLHPVCDPSRSGIEDDPRLPYYSLIEKFTAKYAAEIGMYGSYTHKYDTPSVVDLVHWDSCLIYSGVTRKLNGDLYQRWKPFDPCYSTPISETMHFSYFLQIKQLLKLNDNAKCPKRGEVGYDLAYKYEYAFKVIIENYNAFSEIISPKEALREDPCKCLFRNDFTQLCC